MICGTPWKGAKMSVDFNDISVRDALDQLSFLTGLQFRGESGDAERLISISLREVTLRDIISRISAETGIRIEQTEKGPPIKNRSPIKISASNMTKPADF
jgi:hypothetical protein